MEKHLLRKAFSGWIPEDVLWRSKEGFAEALGKTDLGDIVNQHAELLISDEKMSQRTALYPWNTPETKEEFWYRQLFEQFYCPQKMDTVIHTKIYRFAPIFYDQFIL